jgi:hypothetical protein
VFVSIFRKVLFSLAVIVFAQSTLGITLVPDVKATFRVFYDVHVEHKTD